MKRPDRILLICAALWTATLTFNALSHQSAFLVAADAVLAVLCLRMAFTP